MNQKLIAFVACNGKAAGKERFKKFSSCKEAVASGFQRGECKNGCVGVGSCVKACKKGAMKLVDGKIIVDKKLCDGCGDCAKKGVCPQGLISMVPADATNFIPCSNTEYDDLRVREICTYGCIACGECERACPKGAISIVDNHAVIDYSKCEGCSACSVKCKKKIIIDTKHDVTVLKSYVAFVACAGDGRINQKVKEAGAETCKDAARLDLKELGLCKAGCFGCGACTKVCRYDAIHIVNGVAVVDPDKCVGCKGCVYTCPQRLISIVPYKGQKIVPCSSTAPKEIKLDICSSGCTQCEDCKDNCPNSAIYIEGTHAVIDFNACEDCKVCSYVCRQNLIKQIEVPEYIYLQRQALLDEKKED